MLFSFDLRLILTYTKSMFALFLSTNAIRNFFDNFLYNWWGILITVLVAVVLGMLIIALLYKPFFKVFFDFLISFVALILLSPLFLLIAIIIKATSKGPVFFKQKRVGRNKKLFYIHKFRTMRTDAPKDMPTHLLDNPDAFITKIGKFLRKTSLDELPQLLDIVRFKMSIIGPRPALYNQYDLIEERDKYNANSIRPGLTGLAQVSGRDELKIEIKAKIDGDYIKKRTLLQDIKIFFLTGLKVFSGSGVIEGGTGSLAQSAECRVQSDCDIVQTDNPKKILITGANSYIGGEVQNWLTACGHNVDVLDVKEDSWREYDFGGYDGVFNVAGIAHDISGKTPKELYFKVNYELCLEIANTAKAASVKQFVQMSSMSVFSNSKRKKHITADTLPNAKDKYGSSKLTADLKLEQLADDNFTVAILRPPIIFGKQSKGNFSRLEGLAVKAPFFPKIKNRRSMLYIDNLSCIVRLIIESNSGGIFYPQNSEYFNTSELTRTIAAHKGKRLRVSKLFNPPTWLAFPLIKSIRKLFGNLVYDKELSSHFNGAYQIVDNNTSIAKSIIETTATLSTLETSETAGTAENVVHNANETEITINSTINIIEQETELEVNRLVTKPNE